MFNPPRPEINREIISKAAELFINEYQTSIPYECENIDVIITQLLQHYAPHKNGFDLAKDLEWEGWDIDVETVQALDAFDSYVQDQIQIAEKEWLETNNIQPPLKTGTEVKYMHGKMKKGVITGIYKHRVGCYEIKADGHDDNKDGKMRHVVKWEHVEEIV